MHDQRMTAIMDTRMAMNEQNEIRLAKMESN
jgi:hypothetical protein